MRRALILLALAFPASAQAAQPPKVLQRTDGTLSGPASGVPRDVALRYVRANLDRLGLDRDDLDTLQAPTTRTAGEITTVRWRQAVDGIPAADSELRVNLASDGRVLNVVGEPAHDLRVNTTPAVTAGEAVRAVQDATGSFRALPRAGGPKGATRATAYADDTTAELALDDGRLVWRVTYEAGPGEVYDAFVDARSGLVRRKVNLVKQAIPATVWENYPGAPQGGTANLRDLQTNGWLAPGSAILSGPNAHAYSDINDDDMAALSEEVTSPFARALTTFATPGGGCSVAKPCSWNHNSGNSWMTNQSQSAVQAFYFVNRFHDHLAAAPINFRASSGSFEGADRLVLETHNGAGLNPRLVNNASMLTPPDGRSPRMELRLFRPNGFRTMNAADDGSVVYHEYAHGLSDRLVTDAGGRGALHTPQAGAMSEGWSDWYAKDFIVGQFPSLDTATPGEVDMGAYTDSVPHTIRSQAIDCPVGALAGLCPATGTAGSGGFTYGDFGEIFDGPEVHADGEIWAQTLWDLRGALRTQLGSAAGISAARRLITDGMRLSPPEPTFLDMRNAILLADQAAGGASRSQIWAVFAQRGMGYFATDEPLQDFSTPPGPGVPRGTITGVVTDAATGAAIPNATAAIGSLASGPDRLVGSSNAAGAYSIGSVPARTYPNLVVSAPGYDRALREVTVPAGAVRVDVALNRNWAAPAGGARVFPGPSSDEFAADGCGPEAAVDQLQSTAWSTIGAADGKSMVVEFPQAVDVTGFELDPGEGCGDDADAATRDYRVETSTAGAAGPWTPASTGAFGPLQRQVLNPVSAKVAGVRAVRLTLLSNQGPSPFFDFSELVVHGAPAIPPPPPPPPDPPVVEPPRVPSFTLPASAKRRVRFKVRCAVACRVTAKLTVDRPTARRLKLGRKKLTVVSLNRRVKAGTTTLTMRLPSKSRRLRSYRARLKVTATYPGTKAVSRSRQLRIRR